MSAPTVTTVVITAGNTPFLERTLQQVGAQKPGRVIVANWAKTGLTGINPQFETVNLPKTHKGEEPQNAGQVLSELISRDPSVLASDWVWILHDDCAPKPGCLNALLEHTKEGRTIGVVGPKQYAWDKPDQLLEVGITASRSARRLERIAPGEIDQGQYDNIEDVLAVGSAGMLVSTQCLKQLGGFDPALGPFGDGLEFCRRARLAGYRVVLAPAAGIEHARASYRDIRDGLQVDADASFGRRREAQIYNAILVQSEAGMILILLTLPFVTLLRALWRLITQQPFLAGEEIKAGLGVYKNLGAIKQGHRRVRHQRQVPWRTLRPLEASNAEITRTKRTLAKRERETRPTQTLEPIAAQLLREHILRVRVGAFAGFFLVLLASLALTRAFSYGPTGGAWVSLPDKYSDLWVQAWSGWVISGTGAPGPVDPLLPLMTLLTAPFALVGIAPNTVLIWLWKLAPALAWLAMFTGSSALTQHLRWRLVAATVWIALPSFILSWSAGYFPAAVAHILLPLVMWGWLRCSDSSSVLVIRGASGEEQIKTRVYATSAAAVAALATVGIASVVPWAALAALVIVVILALTRFAHSRSLILTVVPAFVYLIPTWLAAWRAPGMQSLRILLHPSGGSGALEPAGGWELLLGLPVSHQSLPTLTLPWWGPLPQPVTLAVWIAPAIVCLLAGLYGLLVVWRRGWMGQIAVLAGAAALAMAAVSTTILVGVGRYPHPGWPAVALSIAMFAFLVAGLRNLPDDVMVESARTYRARRRAQKAQQRRDRAQARQRQDAAPLDSLTDRQIDTESGRDLADSRLAGNALVESEGDEDGQLLDRPDEAGEAAPLEASHALRTTTASERVWQPITMVATIASFLVPLVLLATWAPTAFGVVNATGEPDDTGESQKAVVAPQADESGRLTMVTPSSAHITPAAAEEAQNGPKRSRLVILRVDDDRTSVEIRRGGGRQLGETSPTLQTQRAIAAKQNQVADDSNALVTGDLETKALSQLVANLLTSPDTDVAAQLHSFAVEQIALLPGSGSAWENAVTALSRNRNLTNAGASELGQLWRARPNGQEPARARLVSGPKSVVVPSSVIGIHTDLGNLKWQDTGQVPLLVLAERADPHWHATINGEALKSVTVGWQQAFEVPQVSGVLRVRWWADWLLGWWIAVGITTTAMLVALVPLRRRIRTNVS